VSGGGVFRVPSARKKATDFASHLDPAQSHLFSHEELLKVGPLTKAQV
jgi:hypothetical protein